MNDFLRIDFAVLDDPDGPPSSDDVAMSAVLLRVAHRRHRRRIIITGSSTITLAILGLAAGIGVATGDHGAPVPGPPAGIETASPSAAPTAPDTPQSGSPTDSPAPPSAPASSPAASPSQSTSLQHQLCGNVAFGAVASSNLVSNIVAIGTDCDTAVSVARAAHGHEGGSFAAIGYSCPTGNPWPMNGMGGADYTCANASGAGVSFGITDNAESPQNPSTPWHRY